MLGLGISIKNMAKIKELYSKINWKYLKHPTEFVLRVWFLNVEIQNLEKGFLNRKF